MRIIWGGHLLYLNPVVLLTLCLACTTSRAQEKQALRLVQTIPMPNVKGRIATKSCWTIRPTGFSSPYGNSVWNRSVAKQPCYAERPQRVCPQVAAYRGSNSSSFDEIC